MRTIYFLFTALLLSIPLCAAPITLFDGKTFAGWEGDTKKTFRIEEGAIVGGSLKEKIVHNEFLCTTRGFTNFVLKVKFKLLGETGFVNGGVQVRSKRIPNHFEVEGYQADMGDGWWGCLYDESRRNKVLIKPNPEVIEKNIRRKQWNDYEIRCDGPRITVRLNGAVTVDYVEEDAKIARSGVIGLQIHGGGPAEAYYKDISIEELP